MGSAVEVSAVARRVRRETLWAWASLALIATEGPLALAVGGPPFLVASVLLLAPGLAVVAFLPDALAAPVVRLAVIPVLGAAISSVAIITTSSAGIPITGASVRLALLLVTLVSLGIQIGFGPRAAPA